MNSSVAKRARVPPGASTTWHFPARLILRPTVTATLSVSFSKYLMTLFSFREYFFEENQLGGRDSGEEVRQGRTGIRSGKTEEVEERRKGWDAVKGGGDERGKVLLYDGSVWFVSFKRNTEGGGEKEKI